MSSEVYPVAALYERRKISATEVDRRYSCLKKSDRARRLTAFGQVKLVIFLRSPKLRRRLDLGHDRSIKATAVCQPCLGRFSRGLLLGRMIKDDRAILRSHVRPLPVHRRRIMVGPKNIQQLFVTDLGRIEINLH